MSVSTRVVLTVVMVGTSFAIWIGGVWVQSWLGLRDLRQFGAMLVVLASPAVLAPLFARALGSILFSDAQLLTSRACLWFGMALLLVWLGIGILLERGVDEGFTTLFAVCGLAAAAVITVQVEVARAAVTAASGLE